MTTVINTHHYGGVDKLPPNSVYIGRPSKHGNNYSSKSGKFSRETCVAFNRIDIYESLVKDPSLFSILKEELEGRNLACWCKQPRRLLSCHGDNYVHIFKKELADRDYSKSVLFYLMDDLRSVLKRLNSWVETTPNESFLKVFMPYFESSMEIKFLLTILKSKQPNPSVTCEYISRIVILLELADMEVESDFKMYWVLMTDWTIATILHPGGGAGTEPAYPGKTVPRRPKKT